MLNELFVYNLKPLKPHEWNQQITLFNQFLNEFGMFFMVSDNDHRRRTRNLVTYEFGNFLPHKTRLICQIPSIRMIMF